MSSEPRFAILVGGGPAPGINGVISAATIEVCKRGIPVIGILDGFRWLASKEPAHTRPLTIPDVSRIHLVGGSILRTARVNPARSPDALARVAEQLQSLNVRWLTTIGGDDTAFAAARVSEATGKRVSVVHVPKTIDNDLPLPADVPTFGFETARHEGVSIVRKIMEDARATSRWYILVAMGRKTGHLALGIGKAAGATVTLVPEEFGERVRLSELANIIEGSIIRRRASDQENGVVVVAEGLAEKLDPSDLTGLENAERDDHGHVRLSELPLGDVLKSTLRQRFAERGISLKIVAKDIGYELRCADPIPFDADYVRDLGFGAARFALDGGSNAMITRQNGELVPIPFGELMDLETGRTRVRMLDTTSLSYRVAREYMIRLDPSDLAEPARLSAMAKAGGTTPDDLLKRFGARA
jgi:ATP-dependent phosphofructokinase / diphosphate-dependent phosphofructokinase